MILENYFKSKKKSTRWRGLPIKFCTQLFCNYFKLNLGMLAITKVNRGLVGT
jgi:hypothetical protein